MPKVKRKRKRIVIDVVALGRSGGLARAAKLTAKQRTAAARAAVNVRWNRARANGSAPHKAELPAVRPGSPSKKSKAGGRRSAA